MGDNPEVKPGKKRAPIAIGAYESGAEEGT
jgi:hypothetical protein